MSGGSLDYIEYRIEEAANTIMSHAPKDALLQALAIHLLKLAPILHDVEWDLSGDATLTEIERRKISSFLGETADLEYLVSEAKRINKELSERLKRVNP